MDTVVRTEIQHVWPGVRGTGRVVYLFGLDLISFVMFNNTDKKVCLRVTIHLVV